VERGARHIVLVGRNGIVPEDGQATLTAMRAAGARVEILAADAPSRADPGGDA
jgi:hypothetical protein